MNRRDVLIGGAVGAVALGNASRSEAAPAPAPTFDPDAMEDALRRIDRRMGAFQSLELGTAQGPDAQLTRATLRTLYFTGAFMELEEHERAHPGVQDRMRRMQGEMDFAVRGMTETLGSLTPEQLRALQQELRDHPDAAMAVGERLNEVAKADGFGFRRRADLRRSFDEIGRRMSAQNPALLIDPVVKKARQLQLHPKTDAERERALRVRAGEEAFFAFEERTKDAAAAWERIYAARPRGDVVALAETYPESVEGGPAPAPIEEWEEEPEDRGAVGRTVLKVGGITMGVGAGSMALGGLFYLISSAGGGAASSGALAVPALVLGVTVGPILLVVGLVIVLVGGAIWLATR